MILDRIKKEIKNRPMLFNTIRVVALPFNIKEKRGVFFEKSNDNVYPLLIKELKKNRKPIAMEMGTKIRRRKSTHNRAAFHGVDFGDYILSDYESGDDVEVVADAHTLSQSFSESSLDLVVSIAVFEHLKYPQIAAHEIMKVLKVGGFAYIDTHQTHHLHGYPSDYYRFSRRALRALFPPEMGVEVQLDYYRNPCSIYSHHTGLETGESYINVGIVIKKIAETPSDFIFNLSHEKN